MPLLKKGVLMPVKGVDFSKPSTFLDDESGFPRNMRYYRNEMMKRPGKTLFGATPMNHEVRGMSKLILPTQQEFLIRNDKKRAQKFNTGTNDWQDISTEVFSGQNEDFFSYANISESSMILMSNGVDPVKKWLGSGAIADLGGSPPRAKYMAYLSPYIVLANLIDGGNSYPWKLAWNDTGAPETWSGGNSGAALLSDEPSPIQNVMKLNSYLGVYKSDSLVLGQLVATADIFQFITVKTGVGLSAPRALADAEGVHYFMGQNDFFAWNGIRDESIGKNVREEVFGSLDRSKINRCHAIHVQELTEIWFFVVPVGSNWPNQVWKYNYRNGYWYNDDCYDILCAIKWSRVNSTLWNQLVGTWLQQIWYWYSADQFASWEDIVFGDALGRSLKLDYTISDDVDVPVLAQFDSKDFVGDRLEYNKRWLQLDVWARGSAKLYVDYSTDFGTTWTNVPYKSNQAYLELEATYKQYQMYFDIQSPQIRFRFRNQESNEVFFLRNFYPYYIVTDEIRGYRQ